MSNKSNYDYFIKTFGGIKMSSISSTELTEEEREEMHRVYDDILVKEEDFNKKFEAKTKINTDEVLDNKERFESFSKRRKELQDEENFIDDDYYDYNCNNTTSNDNDIIYDEIEEYEKNCTKHTMRMTWGVFFGLLLIINTVLMLILDCSAFGSWDDFCSSFVICTVFTFVPISTIAIWTNTKSHYDNAKYAEENNIECERAEKELYKYKVGLVASATCTASLGKSAGRGIKNTFKPSKK